MPGTAARADVRSRSAWRWFRQGSRWCRVAWTLMAGRVAHIVAAKAHGRDEHGHGGNTVANHPRGSFWKLAQRPIPGLHPGLLTVLVARVQPGMDVGAKAQ